jgi:two-component system sensor histidine kinase CpxA
MWPFNRLSLFWKIFLWFWLAMLLMVSVTVVGWMLYRDSINFHPADAHLTSVVKQLATVLGSDMPEYRKQRAIRHITRNFTPPAMLPEQPALRTVAPYFLLDEQGQEKGQHPVPEAVLALWKQQPSQVYAALHRDFIFIGPYPVTLDGKSYQLFVSQFVGRFKLKMILHLFQGFSLWQVFIYLMISAALCLALAWSLTRPIKKLQWASRRIAKGEKVSVKMLLGHRRDEFYRLACDFDLMAEKILETVNTQKQLLSDVSHELRSPLTRMRIALGLLEKNVDDTALKTLQRIDHECDRMDEMIGQLLSIAALERGQVYEQHQLICVAELVTDIIRDVAFEADQKHIVIEADLAPEIELNGYYGLLRSSFENVLRNAIRYSPEQSKVTVSLKQEQHSMVLAIADQGPGVDSAHLEKIFQPFYRTDEARARAQGGAGLGLAIAARAVAVHRGNIVAEANQPSGLRVTVTLPLNAKSK